MIDNISDLEFLGIIVDEELKTVTVETNNEGLAGTVVTVLFRIYVQDSMEFSVYEAFTINLIIPPCQLTYEGLLSRLGD